MKVKELIKQLQNINPEADVMIEDQEWLDTIHDVEGITTFKYKHEEQCLSDYSPDRYPCTNCGKCQSNYKGFILEEREAVTFII